MVFYQILLYNKNTTIARKVIIKMKKLNSKGFVLAETLVVTVFLMILFTSIYTMVFPLMGEYEKREVYDDVDGKYAVYWIKKMIEASAYREEVLDNLNTTGYVRFECKDFKDSNSKSMCVDIVHSMQINHCDSQGNQCDIFITNYLIGDNTDKTSVKYFKNVVRNDTELFSSGFKDYIIYLPDYSSKSLTGATRRVIAIFNHTKDSNNYYSYATIEVNRR